MCPLPPGIEDLGVSAMQPVAHSMVQLGSAQQGLLQCSPPGQEADGQALVQEVRGCLLHADPLGLALLHFIAPALEGC